MLIDIHVHIARHHSSPGLNGRYYPTPEEMIGFMDEAGIDRAVVMTRVSPECGLRLVPPEDVLEMCALHPTRFIPFCGVDPRMLTNSPRANFCPILEYYKECGCKGIGEYPHNVANWSEVDYLKQSLEQGGISQEVFDKITWENANRVLGLEQGRRSAQ